MIISKRADKNYTIISNEIIYNSDISNTAKLLYIMLQSYGLNWEFNVNHFKKMLNCSRESVYSARKELIHAGLLMCEQKRGKEGKFNKGTIYVLTHGLDVQEVDLMLDNLQEKELKTLQHSLADSLENAKDNFKYDFIENDFLESSFIENDFLESTPTIKNKNLDSINDFEIEGGVPFDIFENVNFKDNKEATPQQNANETESEISRSRLNYTHIKDKVYNNTKSLSRKNLAIIDINETWKQVNEILNNYKQTQKIKKEALNNQKNNFYKALTNEQQEAYNEFIKYRQTKLNGGLENKKLHTKKLPQSTILSIQRHFKKLIDKGQNMAQVVENSINHGWSGLFEIKEFKKDSINFKTKKPSVSKFDKESSEMLERLLLKNGFNPNDSELMQKYKQNLA